jgi:RNA polymerase sigma-70 factor (ECF subfamily)
MIAATAAFMQGIPRIGYGSYARIGLNYPLMDPLSDDFLVELVSKSRQGDLRSMEILYGHFKSSLFSLAYRYTYNFAVAEDLLQDIFVKVFTNLHTLDEDRAFTGWMYRVAVNTCLSYVRSRKRVLQKTVPLEDVEAYFSDVSSDDVEKTANKPLEEAIQSLPAKLRSAFILHDVQGFKHREVAQMMGCSVGTSKSQLFKARKKIRKYLESKKLL